MVKAGKVKSGTPLQLANPTQLQLVQLHLVGVGVDSDFPLEGQEGRNPHLASSRRIGPTTCLKFGDCLVGVWRVYGNCLEGVWQYLAGVFRVSGECLEGVLSVSGRCLKGIWEVS